MSSDRYVPIDRYLLPREVRIATIRQHPYFLVPSLTAAFGGLLAAVAVSVASGQSKAPQIIAWLLAAVLVARFMMVASSWWIRYMVITSARFMLISGVLSRRVKVIPYSALMEMSFARSFAGRLLGFGTFTIEAGGRPVIIMDYIPYSEQIQLVLTGQVYPGSWERPSDGGPAREADDNSYDYQNDPDQWMALEVDEPEPDEAAGADEETTSTGSREQAGADADQETAT